MVSILALGLKWCVESLVDHLFSPSFFFSYFDCPYGMCTIFNCFKRTISPAFSPPNPRHRPSARVAGAGTNGKQQQLQSSNAITPPVSKSTTPTSHLANDTTTPKSPSSSESNNTISSRNVKKNIIVKNVPDRNRKGGAKSKSFKALKDLR